MHEQHRLRLAPRRDDPRGSDDYQLEHSDPRLGELDVVPHTAEQSRPRGGNRNRGGAHAAVRILRWAVEGGPPLAARSCSAARCCNRVARIARSTEANRISEPLAT